MQEQLVTIPVVTGIVLRDGVRCLWKPKGAHGYAACLLDETRLQWHKSVVIQRQLSRFSEYSISEFSTSEFSTSEFSFQRIRLGSGAARCSRCAGDTACTPNPQNCYWALVRTGRGLSTRLHSLEVSCNHTTPVS